MFERGVFRILRDAFQIFTDRDLSLVAAGVAFYFMLSLFPAMAALVALWGLVFDPAQVGEQLTLVKGVLPPQIYDLLDMRVAQLVSADQGSLGLASALTTLLALFTARLGVAALMRALNTVYETQPRGGIKQLFVVIVLTLTLIGLGLLALASVVVAPIAVAILPLVPADSLIVGVVRWGVAIVAITLGLSLLYRYGPKHVGARASWISPGSVFAFFGWLIISAALSIYLTTFPRFSQVYGSIGAAIALMLWLYLSALVILLGAVLNVVLLGRRREKREALQTEKSPG